MSETTPYTAAEMVEHLSGSDNDLDDSLMGFPGFKRLPGAHDDRAQIDLTFEAAAESGRATTEFRVTIERVPESGERPIAVGDTVRVRRSGRILDVVVREVDPPDLSERGVTFDNGHGGQAFARHDEYERVTGGEGGGAENASDQRVLRVTAADLKVTRRVLAEAGYELPLDGDGGE